MYQKLIWTKKDFDAINIKKLKALLKKEKV